MNYKEVKQELKKEFESFLKPLGYKSKNGLQGCTFSIIKNNVHYSIVYGITNYIDEFHTGCSVGIGIIPIQKILYHYIQEVKEVKDNYGSTIRENTDTYMNELNYDYKIQTIDDIKEWGKIVRKFYAEFAVPFFEKYRSVDAIDKLLNNNLKEPTYLILGWRIIIGLIAAKLNNNPKYNELRDYYSSLLGNEITWQVLIDKCMKVINFLDKYTSEELNNLAEEI
jgi:hypothetical protein